MNRHYHINTLAKRVHLQNHHTMYIQCSIKHTHSILRALHWSFNHTLMAAWFNLLREGERETDRERQREREFMQIHAVASHDTHVGKDCPSWEFLDFISRQLLILPDNTVLHFIHQLQLTRITVAVARTIDNDNMCIKTHSYTYTSYHVHIYTLEFVNTILILIECMETNFNFFLVKVVNRSIYKMLISCVKLDHAFH